MNISSLAGALWAAGFAEHAALLLVLIVKRRWRTFHYFSAIICFNVVRTIVLFLTFRSGSGGTYFKVYWIASAFDLVLQILVVLEVLTIVLKPAGVWAVDAQKKFQMVAFGGIVPAVALAFAIHHHLPRSVWGWVEQGELFAVTLAVVLLVAMASATTALGLVWRRHVAALATGWAVWSFVSFFVEGAYSYFGQQWHGVTLDYIRIFTYQLVTIYWAIMFWRAEPQKRTLAPEQREYLSSLQNDVAGQINVLSSNRKQ